MSVTKSLLFYLKLRNRKMDDIQEYLDECCKIDLPIEKLKSSEERNFKNIKIKMTLLFPDPATIEANSTVKGVILISAGWANVLLRSRNKETRMAFQMTLGHEYGHKLNKDLKPRKMIKLPNKSERKFVHWTNEVHHDFYSAYLMADSRKNVLVSTMEFKMNLKKGNASIKKGDTSHPSWNQRLKWAKKGTFDSALIDEIAATAKCDNADLIEKVKENYSDKIILT